MVRWFLSITLPCTGATRNTPAVASPGHPPPSPPSLWGPARGAGDGKWLFLGKWLFGSIPPSHGSSGPGGGGVPAPGWEGDGYDLTSGAWGLRGVEELLWSSALGRALQQSFP